MPPDVRSWPIADVGAGAAEVLSAIRQSEKRSAKSANPQVDPHNTMRGWKLNENRAGL